MTYTIILAYKSLINYLTAVIVCNEVLILIMGVEGLNTRKLLYDQKEKKEEMAFERRPTIEVCTFRMDIRNKCIIVIQYNYNKYINKYNPQCSQYLKCLILKQGKYQIMLQRNKVEKTNIYKIDFSIFLQIYNSITLTIKIQQLKNPV